MSLRISLRDGEKMIVNGAIFRATGRTDLMIENPAAVLRGRDIMAPDEAVTPAQKLYFACMMAYIHPDGLATHQAEILGALRALMVALPTEDAQALCVQFATHVASSEFYKALAPCRRLIALERDGLEPAHGTA